MSKMGYFGVLQILCNKTQICRQNKLFV
ncbi:hypothetical protein E2C01_068406 [Portunus trituberculatus]|uniref:Uncharacterized protein n=1 Tax=Portunus trituberculatus TaxID=210409 RepID=A0A5B7HMB3_PORTR|nr:hypothetical protein [Portunus trituberculatus]